MRRWLIVLNLIVILVGGGDAGAQISAYVKLNLVCSPTNDLYSLLVAGGQPVERFDTIEQAITSITPESALFILADDYPFKPVVMTEKQVDRLADKKVRIYAEFVSTWARNNFGKPREANSLRVVTHTKLGNLPSKTILTIHNCAYMTYPYGNPKAMLARVAGFNVAPFDLPEWVNPKLAPTENATLLAPAPLGRHILAATKLSNFTSNRFERPEQWREVWTFIIQTITGRAIELPQLVSVVKPTYVADAALPADASAQALQRASQWYLNSKMLVHPAWKQAVEQAAAKDGLEKWPGVNAQAGDGTLGVLEGFASRFDATGRNMVRCSLRADSTGESALALAAAGKALNDPRSTAVAQNLAAFVFNSPLAQGTRATADSASYGLLDFEVGAPWGGVYYGDSNARCLLGLIGAEALLGTDQWDEALVRVLLANFRTSGKNGFRDSYITEADLKEKGWRPYFESEPPITAPYYQAYLWACYLWAYQHTGYEPFKQKAAAGITAMMSKYDKEWPWTLGLQEERAKMLLPLAWLVRVDGSDENKARLKALVTDMLKTQDASGALGEQLGVEGLGILPPAKSNEEYGRQESPVIQTDNDPGADLMYTMSFAFFGLHEAAAATGDEFYSSAEQKMADFLCRAQVKSILRPELDGTWFRGFDYKNWAFWGTDSDMGWGAWSVESGMSHGWITTVLALRKSGTSFWDATANVDIKSEFTALQPTMLPAP